MPTHESESQASAVEGSTRKSNAQQPVFTNRLSREMSPYLLQHAHNPVAWWPWGEEAFAQARRRDVPIFLSIGYSTCYWCHVMERESFEHAEIAALLNECFVCIKVDREERPEVDNLYMAAAQVSTGRGGWPMSLFLEPEQLRPFYCGMYFPAEAKPGMQGPTFPQLLEGMAGAWAEQREGVVQQAAQIAEAVREHLAGGEGAAGAPVPVGSRDVERVVERLLAGFDQVHGGFGTAPKFPQTVYAEFLLDAREQASEPTTREAIDRVVRASLDAMAIGGIRDHVGGGFHRYATDAAWTVPHFEKMLYDQALLARLFVRAAAVYDDAEYKRVVREILEFVLREMRDAGGGFFAAQDAEVDGREGANYLWTPTQIAEVLDPGEAEFAAEVYGLGAGPNFRDPHHPGEPPSNVLRLAARPEALAARFNLSRDEFLMKLAGVNRVLYAARAQRKQPRLDETVIAAWNGLMIAAFAEASVLFGDARYFEAAARAAEFVLGEMIDKEGRLQRCWRAGQTSGPGALEDSAGVLTGLLVLAKAAGGRDAHPTETGGRDAHPTETEESKWGDRLARQSFLDAAERVYAMAAEDFRGEDMGLYDTRADRKDLFVRTRTTYDGAMPCGSSVMLHAVLDLAAVTGDATALDEAVSLLRSLSSTISRDPVAAVNSTRGLLRLLGMDRSKQEPEVFLRGSAEDAEASETPAPLSSKAGETTAPPGEVEKGGPAVMPVEMYAETDRVSVSLETPAELVLLVRIAEGYHLTAADPRVSDETMELVPFRVLVRGGSGVAVYADYPEGEERGAEGLPFRAYADHFELRVAIEQTGELLGRPRLAITYQACTATGCRLPRTVELDVAIEGE